MTQPTAYAITEYRTTFKIIGVQQASLSILGLASGLLAYYLEPNNALLLPTLLLGAIFSFTVLFIGPVKAQLNDPNLDNDSPQAKDHSCSNGSQLTLLELFCH
jgi:hypothetical protein